MRIAIINDLLGAGSNGTFVATYNLVDHLKRQGHEVRVICPDQSKRGDSDYFVVPVRDLGAPINKYVQKVGVSISKCSRELMAKALDGVQYIHCITPFRLAVYAADYARKNDIPISAGFHVMAENITAYFRMDGVAPLNTHIYRRMYKKLYSKVDGIHYPTSFVQNHFECRIGADTPAYVISNGADKSFRRAQSPRPAELQGKFVITSTGRYSREKAQEVLIRAVARSKHEKDIQLVLAGHGAREGFYRRLAKGLDNPPIFRTFSREEMVSLLNCTDLYVHPAYIELEGIACLEAIKCGVPAVVSDSPYSATYDFAATGDCVFISGDDRALAARIDAFIDRPKVMERARQRTLEKDVKYTDECMALMDDMFADIVSGKRGGRLPALENMEKLPL